MNRRTVLTMTAAALALVASQATADTKKIAIANFGEHPQLNAAAEGFKETLLASGLDVEFTEDHINFDFNLLPQMIAKIAASEPDLIYSITTPVTQNVKNQLGEMGIPIVFNAVTDPVKAELVPSWETAGENITGVSDTVDFGAILEFSRQLFPDAKTFGVPYNPSEANDLATLEGFKSVAGDYGFEVAEVGIDNVNDIMPRITSLSGKADVIFGPTSNLIQPAISAVAAAATEAGTPVINSGVDAVATGELAAGFAASYEKLGALAGAMAIEILNGTPVSEVPPAKSAFADYAQVISAPAMATLGYDIPDSFAGCDCVAD